MFHLELSQISHEAKLLPGLPSFCCTQTLSEATTLPKWLMVWTISSLTYRRKQQSYSPGGHGISLEVRPRETPLANACNEEALSIAQHVTSCGQHCALLCRMCLFLGIAFDALPSEPYSWDYLRRGFSSQRRRHQQCGTTTQQQLFRRRGCIIPGKELVHVLPRPFIPWNSGLWNARFWHLSQTHQKKSKPSDYEFFWFPTKNQSWEGLS